MDRHQLANKPGVVLGLVVGPIIGTVLWQVTREGLWPIAAGVLGVLLFGPVLRRWTLAAWLVGLTVGYTVFAVPNFLFHRLS